MKRLNAAPPPYASNLALFPRIQWNENSGYCGETSFITVGLYYGQYLSQYDARTMACARYSQSDPRSQLLLGPGNGNQNNDMTAATAMHLAFNRFAWDSETSTTEFLSWVKQMIVSGYPVVIGVLMNTSVFNTPTVTEVPDPDPEYDHIVPVHGVGSNHPLSDVTAYPDDAIYFYDNGVYRVTNGVYDPAGVPVNEFECDFGSFQTTRQGANTGSRPYSLIVQNNRHYNYGIAFTGIQGGGSNLLPVQVTTDPNQETNEIIDGCDARPQPINLRVSLKVLNPTGVAYSLYRFSSFADAAALDYLKAVQMNPTTPNPMDSIASDTLAIYRAVRVADTTGHGLGA